MDRNAHTQLSKQDTNATTENAPANRPLDYIAMEILNLSQRSTNSNQVVLIMTDRYFKLAGVMPKWTTRATHVVTILYDRWIIPYRIQAYLLAYNSTQFVSVSIEII